MRSGKSEASETAYLSREREREREPIYIYFSNGFCVASCAKGLTRRIAELKRMTYS